MWQVAVLAIYLSSSVSLYCCFDFNLVLVLDVSEARQKLARELSHFSTEAVPEEVGTRSAAAVVAGAVFDTAIVPATSLVAAAAAAAPDDDDEGDSSINFVLLMMARNRRWSGTMQQIILIHAHRTENRITPARP